MTLAHPRMIIYELLNKDPDVFPKEAPLVILDIKSSVCMDKNGKNNNHTRHITISVNFARNDENYKMHKIDWCEKGLKLADILTKNVGENDLHPRMKYIMVRNDN